jgi:uncharacterized protein (TIGR00269 family)
MMNVKNNYFIQNFEKSVRRMINRFKLLSKKDKILIAVSGGKDSTAILYVLKKLGYLVEAVTINALIGNYSKHNLENIKDFCRQQKIKLYIISFREEFGYSLCYIRDVLKSKGMQWNSCTLCGVLKRYLLNKYTRKLKATKLVTGHNMDDVAQSILMNFFRNQLEMSSRLGPITGLIKDKKFVSRVKPLYLTAEVDVEKYSKIMDFPVKYSRCPCSSEAYRNTVRNLLHEYEQKHHGTKKRIVTWYLRNLRNIKKYYYSDKKMSYCEKCGEPSRKELCMACFILEKLK